MDAAKDRLLTVLAAQVKPVAYDPDACLEKFERVVRVAVSSFPSVDLIVFPELFASGQDPLSGHAPVQYQEKVADPVPGPVTERMSKVAERSRRWILGGSMYERADDTIYNTAVLFSPEGELVARHRKVFPWRPWETVSPGEGLTFADIEGRGRIGLMTCYEGWFPEVPRGLALLGAELILQPSMTTTADREEELVLARANAIANQCFVINVNASTTIGGGRSIGVDAEGRTLFEGGTGEELILQVVDLSSVGIVRDRGTRGLNPLLKELRDAPSEFLAAYARLVQRSNER